MTFILLLSMSILLIDFSLNDPWKITASEFNFAVETEIPENQINKDKTYFDLMMDPGSKQDLIINLRNDTDSDVKIHPIIQSATTNINGVVEYGLNDIEKDPTLKYKMDDIVKVENEIIIPANGTYELKLTVEMPKEEFDGILAGGITLQEVVEETNTTNKNNKGMSIKNNFAYVIAILLRENNNDISPKLKLNDVFPDQVNSRNVIMANIQNIKSIYINKMAIKATITEKGKAEVLYEANKENLQMAPNTNFNFPIALNGERLAAGDYILDITVQSNGEKWHWKREFKIDGETAKKLNESDVTIQNDFTWLYVLCGALILLSTLIILIVFLKRKKNKVIRK
ncbi:DUF916 and DUF3324 domain-containing protein [Cytobacillus sp. Sa5YUA1]|uniref:DUF916 and DUF3324 domain-containing protein n=2 Tax=Cytobacillus stercorigallinarum TaxID=2762240 RepID=A0ABR8QM38_9BACI|nr:DUF916 and DUF3324 domain-containing protein [Cytobacillus stercorigallinarum]